MNHQAETHMQGSSATQGKPGIHMSANVGIVVPYKATFAPAPVARPMKVDITKVSVTKKA